MEPKHLYEREILRLTREGMLTKRIQEHVGCSRSTVFKTRKKFNVPSLYSAGSGYKICAERATPTPTQTAEMKDVGYMATSTSYSRQPEHSVAHNSRISPGRRVIPQARISGQRNRSPGYDDIIGHGETHRRTCLGTVFG